jgi:hypothetical protein
MSSFGNGGSDMLHPVERAVANAPLDDEPVTEEDRLCILAGHAAIREQNGTPMEEFLAEFGLTMEDFPLDRDADL